MNQGAKIVNYHIPGVNPDYIPYICGCMKRCLAIICCIWLLMATVVGQTTRDNWMANLPDSMLVRKVSIPGTHDSGTAGVRFPMRHYARTQTMDLSEQWDAGIRFFDLRPKPADGTIKIYHGPADCHLTLEDALLTLKGRAPSPPSRSSSADCRLLRGPWTPASHSQKVCNGCPPSRAPGSGPEPPAGSLLCGSSTRRSPARRFPERKSSGRARFGKG